MDTLIRRYKSYQQPLHYLYQELNGYNQLGELTDCPSAVTWSRKNDFNASIPETSLC